jgi:hypothetical protein
MTHSKEDTHPKIALWDADFICYRVGFASEDDPEAIALARATEFIQEVSFTDLDCREYKLYLTGKGNFRNEIAVTQPYKGNRKDFVRPKHYDALRKHLQALGAIVTDGQEADDAVAIEMTEHPDKYVLVGQDKDLLQIEGLHYNPVKKEFTTITKESGMKNFYTQILTGDRTDNIKGVDKIGPVKAEKLLKDCKTELEMWDVCVKAHGSIERATEDARLLWLRREPNQLWSPPSP